MEKELTKYAHKHNLSSIEKLGYMLEVAPSLLRKINLNPKTNISIAYIQKIYENSITHFNDPLTPDMYLDFNVLKTKHNLQKK